MSKQFLFMASLICFAIHTRAMRAQGADRKQESLSISGKVVDPKGEPLEGATINWLGSERVASAKTDEDGKFVLHAKTKKTTKRNLVRAYKFGYEAMDGDKFVEWGATKLVFRLRRVRTGPVELTVVMAGTGKPVERYAIRILRDPGAKRPWTSLSARIRDSGFHEGGKHVLADIPMGYNTWMVFPQGDELLPSEEIRFLNVDNCRLRVELRRAVEVPLTVALADGTPIQGARVEVLRRQIHTKADFGIPTEITASTMALSPRDMYERGSGASIAWLVASAVTDKHGKAVLRCLPSLQPCVLRVKGGRHHAVALQDLVVAKAGVPVQMLVPRGATLSGRIHPVTLVKRLEGQFAGTVSRPTLKLLEVAAIPRFLGTSILGQADRNWEVASDGSFEIHGLPAGSWSLHLRGWHKRRPHDLLPPLANINLVAGKKTEVVIDGTSFDPGRLSGTIVMDGKPLADTELYLAFGFPDGRGGITNHGGWMQYRTDAQGKFDMQRLDPTHYCLQVRMHTGSQHATIAVKDWFRLPPRGDVQLPIRFSSTKLELKVLRANGETSVGRRPIQLRRKDIHSLLGSVYGELDEDGKIVVDPCPTGEFEVSIWPRNWLGQRHLIPWQKHEHYRRSLGTIDVSAKRRELSLELRIKSPRHK